MLLFSSPVCESRIDDMHMEQLISSYGYLAVLVGTFLEGETVLVMAGFAAHRGYLELPWVIGAAFLGTLLGDQVYFHLGRTRGARILEKRPIWKAKSEKVFSLLRKHPFWVIFGFRFFYGLRTVTPFLIGMGRMSPLRFLILNSAGSLIWAVTVGISGHLFGQTLEIIIGDIKRYEWQVFGIFLFIGMIIWSFFFIVRKRR